MRHFREQVLIACTAFVFLLLITTEYATAQDVPSHTQVSPAPGSVFDFPVQLTFFESLATYSNGIIANVTQGNFTNANALLAAYNRTVDSLNAAANNPQQNAAMAALASSRNDFGAFIKNAQRYNDLYVNETSLIAVAPRSNGSIANALEMKTLSTTLKGLETTIGERNADIYGIAVDNGLDLSRYGNSTALFNAYTKQVDSRLANVTTSVFLTPTLTLTGNENSTAYGDRVVLAGSLQDNETGGINGVVEIHVDNTTVATVRTNASGSYAYPFVVRTLAPGTHVAFAKYAPINVPYNPAQSPKLNFSVAKSPVTNTLSVLSGSIALGSDLQARGQLKTPNGPVTNATVSLFVGDANVAQTQTDQNGTYAFSVPATGLYLPAVLNGASGYTVFDPTGLPLDRSESAAIHVPADLMAIYGMIIVVTLVVLLGIFFYSRRVGRRAPVVEVAFAPAEAPAIRGRAARPVAPTPPTTTTSEPTIDWYAARDQARHSFAQGDDESATRTLFNAAVASLSAATGVRLAAHMTYWEKFWAISGALPDVNAPLRELTTAYELANYSGRSFTQAQRDAALGAYDSLHRHVKSAEGRP